MKLLIVIFLLLPYISFAQCGGYDCDKDNSSMILRTPQEISVDYESMRDYIYSGGHLLINAIRLEIKVPECTGNCKWALRMVIDNYNGIAPPPIPASGLTEWYPAVRYSTNPTPVYPAISKLLLRVTNECQTPINNGVWQNFISDGDILDIIPNGILIPVDGPPCVGLGNQVNGPGSYLIAYDQFNFKVDLQIMINAGDNYSPGLYKLDIKFELVDVGPTPP